VIALRLTDAQVRAVMNERIDRINHRILKVLTSGLVMTVAGVIAAWAFLRWAGVIK